MDSKLGGAHRRGLQPAKIAQELQELENTWAKVEIFDSVSSTNDVILEHLSKLALFDGLVVIADEQTKGRGRLEREWTSPWGAGIAMSIALNKQKTQIPISTVPLFAGLCVIQSLESLGASAQLKWPNDIVTFDEQDVMRKLGGILAQLHQDVLVIGIGLNVDLDENELPTQMATSLSLAGFTIEREKLIARIISNFSEITNSQNLKLESWMDQYRKACCTIGQELRISQVAGEALVGRAIAVSNDGALQIEIDGVVRDISVGDVEHVRAVDATALTD